MINTYKNNNNTILEINLAGHNPKDVEITVSGDKLTVESVKKAREWEKASKTFFNHLLGKLEYEYIDTDDSNKDERFSQSWQLLEADRDKITSSWDNGLLLITIPPKEEECRKIKIS